MLQALRDFILYFQSLDARYQVVTLLVVIMVIASIVLSVIILRERSRKNQLELREARIRREAEPIIQEVIFSEQDSAEGQNSIKRLKRIIQSRFYRKANLAILNDILIHYRQNLGGESSKKLESLFRELELKDESLDLLKKGDWHEKAKAINDLSIMNMRELLFELLQYVDHPNSHVRNEAQFAAVKLGGKRALNFLDDLESPLSEWQQIKILDEVLRFEYQVVEKMATWLRSKNDSVVMFALLLMAHTNQYGERGELCKLLYHKSEKVQIRAMETAVALAYDNCAENLYEIYELTKSMAVKVRVLRSMGELGGAKEVGFLREIMLREKHYDLVLEAGRSLKRMGRKDLLQITGSQEAKMHDDIVTHLQDGRI